MIRANGIDRALLHGLHERIARHGEPVNDAALGAVMRVAQAYMHATEDDESSARTVVAEFDEDSLALVDILARAVLQLKLSDTAQSDVQFG